MYARQTTYEEVMTLDEARKIIKAETQEKREEIVEFAEAIGFFLLCILCTILCPIMLDGDITGWFVTVPGASYFVIKAKAIFKRMR